MRLRKRGAEMFSALIVAIFTALWGGLVGFLGWLLFG